MGNECSCQLYTCVVNPYFDTTDNSALLGQDELGLSKEEAPSAVDKVVFVGM